MHKKIAINDYISIFASVLRLKLFFIPQQYGSQPRLFFVS